MRSDLLVFAVCFQFFASASWAALGDKSVSSSSAKIKSSATNGANYSVSEGTDAAGVKIREYSDASGFVFAVSWVGPVLPKLDSVLGSYLTEYKNALASYKKVKGSRSVQIQTQNLVVEGFGRVGAQGGRAYLPANVPQGFDIGDIQYNE